MKISSKYYYLDFATNILVVAVGAMLIGLLGYWLFFQPSLGSLEAELLRAGEDFKGLQEVDFKKSPNTILLATDVTCQFCTQALPFYKKLIAKSKENPGVRVVAVFSNEKEEVVHYLLENDVDIEFIPNVDLVKLKVDVTPTVIWVDANRKIVGSYQGLLQEKQETAFFGVYEKRLFGR